MKKILPLIAVGLFLVVIFFMTRRSNEQNATTTPAAETGVSEVVHSASKDGQAKGADPFLQGAAAEAIPWHKTSLKTAGGASKLNIVVEVRKWCAMGDMDVIRLDDRASQNKTMILSVEPLIAKDDSLAPLQATFRIQDLEKGFKTSFSIPAFSEPKQLGLFLCRSSRDRGRCSEEPPVDYNVVMTEHLKNPNRNPASEPSRDRLYFFQYIFLEAPNSLLSFQNPLIPEASFDQLSRYLDKIGSDAKRAGEKDALAQAKSFTTALKSLPLEYEGETVRVVLPVLDTDKKNCPDPAPPQ